MAGDVQKSVISAPSQLGETEIARWKEMQQSSPRLHRAFFSPAFSLACEVGGFDTRVALIRRGDLIEALYPFQYHNRLHKWAGIAEQIGGHLADSTGIIAGLGWRTSPAELVRLCGVGAIHVSCLADGQTEFGLDSYQVVPNYIVDLSQGYERYFEDLRSRNPDFVRDTGRRFRRATRSLGSLTVKHSDTVDAKALDRLVAQKRAQYKRTNKDGLNDVRTLRVLKYLATQTEESCKVFHTTLEAGGRVIAEHFGLLYSDVLSYWLPVYDWDFQQYSPGRLMLWELIKEAPQHGITTIDFGEGDAQYKRQFSNKSISSYKAYWGAGDIRTGIAKAYQSFYWRTQSLHRAIPTKPKSLES